MIHEGRKSDRPIVAEKSPNKGEPIAGLPAEEMEPRGLTKGNPSEQTRFRTQSRGDLQQALERVRQAAMGDSGLQFTALWHHVYDIERLRKAYLELKRNATPGVDRVTWKSYGETLDANLTELSDRLKRGAYRAKPVKRAFIPKPDGGQRPLGVTTLEDKIVQRATTEVLNAIYEVYFLGFSYGFRPGRSPHQALDALAYGIQHTSVNWVLDADIRGFFDSIDHEWLLKFVEHRIRDERVLRHIKKWLNAGVLEEGKRIVQEEGTPQGASISPLLANIYLHYVFDLFAQHWRKHKAAGAMVIVRFADDFIVAFEHKSDAEAFLEELRERFAKFNLQLHPDKTRLIEFGRNADQNRRGRGEGKPESFDFLGFTHSCDKTKKGKFIVLRQTIKKRMRRKLKAIKQWLREHLHDSVEQVGKHLRIVIQGHFQYFAVPRNGQALRAFTSGIGWLWYKALKRRSQTAKINWYRMQRLIWCYFPIPRILHPYPEQRLAVMTQGKSRMR